MLPALMNSTNIHLPGSAEAPAPLATFDFSRRGTLHGMAHLGGAKEEIWFAPGPAEAVTLAPFEGAQTPDYLFLATSEPCSDGGTLRKLSKVLYQALLGHAMTHGYTQPVRFWNNIPDINRGAGDQEHYRQFCWGRAEAFDGWPGPMPAASGTGSQDGLLYIAMLAASPRIQVRHHENPRQVSAFKYPKEYGPRSPSFARATHLSSGNQELYLLSGTASIVEHRTLHEGRLDAQLRETRKNIRALRDIYPQLVPGGMRCYLRYPAQLADCQAGLHAYFEDMPDMVLLQSDLCRTDLLVEIEGVCERPLY